MSSFNNLFDQWAPVYDKTVYDLKGEYGEVFENYDTILNEICNKLSGDSFKNILEIGIGTGNLTQCLKFRGFNIVGIEPSLEMRKISSAKLKDTVILNGSFLNIPIDFNFDGIVTSYALHHLSYEEKKMAIAYLDGYLNKGGKIVIADTMYETVEYKEALLKTVEDSNAINLLKDLNTEHYELLEDIIKLFSSLKYKITAEKQNK